MSLKNGAYLTNVAAAISGRDGFTGNAEEAAKLHGMALTSITMYSLFIILFSVGAAVLSYKYNTAIGTPSGLMVVYIILSFMFSSLYYPYYALVLTEAAVRGKRKA
jgi:hypothetical protein